MSNLTPKSIVDKNGKQTTVNVKADASTALDRAKTVPVTPPALIDEAWTPNEAIDFREMRKRAKAIHPNAIISLRDGRWIIEIDPSIDESDELPERFIGTPAGDENALKSSGGQSELRYWASENGMSGYPLELIAESYNVALDKVYARRDWFDAEFSRKGLRSVDEITKGHVDLVTPEEREIFLEYMSGGQSDELVAYLNEKFSDEDKKIEHMTDEFFED